MVVCFAVSRNFVCSIFPSVLPVLESIHGSTGWSHKIGCRIVIKDGAIKAGVTIEIWGSRLINTAGICDRITILIRESIDQILACSHGSIALKSTRIKHLFHCFISCRVLRNPDASRELRIYPVNSVDRFEGSRFLRILIVIDSIDCQFKIHHFFGIHGSRVPPGLIVIRIETRACPSQIDCCFDRFGCDAINSRPIEGAPISCIGRIVCNKIIPVGDRNVLVCRVTISDDLFYTFIIGIARQIHIITDIDRFSDNWNAQKLSVQTFSAKFLKQIPFEPCS